MLDPERLKRFVSHTNLTTVFMYIVDKIVKIDMELVHELLRPQWGDPLYYGCSSAGVLLFDEVTEDIVKDLTRVEMAEMVPEAVKLLWQEKQLVSEQRVWGCRAERPQG